MGCLLRRSSSRLPTFAVEPACKCDYNARFGGTMSESRRQFLAIASASLLAAAAAKRSEAQNPPEQPPGEPPAFGTGPAVGPEVSPATFAEAEKLVQVELNDTERAMAAASWRQNLASLYQRRTVPRQIPLAPSLAPPARRNP